MDIVKIAETLVNWRGEVTVAPTTEKFEAKKHFALNTPANIKCFGDNFTNWFLSGDGKTEGSFAGSTLRYGAFRKNTLDAPVIAEIGGEAKVETTLAELHSLLLKQANGEKGVLLTDGCANVFYIRDGSGVLRAVSAHWSSDDRGWDVYANEVARPHGWPAVRQVFSRK